MKFRAKMEINGVNPYVLVTAERAKRLKPDWRRPMPVLVQINGKPTPPWPINMMPVGNGDFYLYLHEIVRKASDTKVGDEVTVVVIFDAAYRGGPTQKQPDGLEQELARNPRAREFWDSLSPSRQKEVVRYLDKLKSEEAKARNMERLIRVLNGSTERFLGRVWH
jgi:hypothetical protein